MTPLQHEMVDGMAFQEQDLGTPTFTWNGMTYNLIPSVSLFNRQLEQGGFETVRLMTAVVRMMNYDGSSIFTNIPQPQQKITYNIDSNLYRIEIINLHPTKTYFEMKAVCPYRGI
jgi:hypothetical protein